MRGFVNIYKPEGMSSATAVNAVKKKLHTPCGHMGTLDPMAEGVLPVGISKTSRLFPYLLEKQKTYHAVFKFGETTDTLDRLGVITESGKRVPEKEEIERVLSKFIGDIEQVPPKYSAKCVEGKRGYQLARAGVEFELAPKKVHIDSIKLDKKISESEYMFTIECKGGTYIRSLCRDIAKELNTVAVMTKLVRSSCGVFNIENSVGVQEFFEAEKVEKYILPSDMAVNYEKLILKKEQATKILNGVYLNYGFSDGIYRVYNGEEFWGVGVVKDGVLKIESYVKE